MSTNNWLHISCSKTAIPYSGKVWWGKSLAKLVNLAKLQVIPQWKPSKPTRRPVNHRHSPNFSSPKLLDAQFAKLFPHQTFPLYGTASDSYCPEHPGYMFGVGAVLVAISSEIRICKNYWCWVLSKMMIQYWFQISWYYDISQYCSHQFCTC